MFSGHIGFVWAFFIFDAMLNSAGQIHFGGNFIFLPNFCIMTANWMLVVILHYFPPFWILEGSLNCVGHFGI